MTAPAITPEERAEIAAQLKRNAVPFDLRGAFRSYEAALSAAEARIDELEKRLRSLADAAERIRHWHDAMKDGSGMVVSKEHVFLLWEETNCARAALEGEKG